VEKVPHVIQGAVAPLLPFSEPYTFSSALAPLHDALSSIRSWVASVLVRGEGPAGHPGYALALPMFGTLRIALLESLLGLQSKDASYGSLKQ
jgi:hypothetical protein